MVQRFKPDDIHKDHRPKTGQKTEFSSQKHDGRNHESKKIMKKSVSFKVCDVGSDLKGFELFKTTKKTKAIDLHDVDGLVSLPQFENDHLQQPSKSSKSEVSTTLPNYMKPTRSSGAKKDLKEAKKKVKNSKTDQSGRCLMKITSVKLARNLTKSSSFKQITSVKKSVPLITSSKDTRVQKPTCSSRLKDYKFPSHVMIEAGGSEANGASKMEVCSYKYCSLNGHCRTNPQPLKSFISDRRRALKQQENLKLIDENEFKKVPFCGGNEIKEEEEFFIDVYEKVELEGNNLLATGIEADCDEELYETIWAAYEKEIQEFEYIEAQMEEEVYIKIENEEHFDYTISDDVIDICNEDVLEECCEDEDECSNSYNSQSQNDETVSSYTEDLVDKEMVFAEDEATTVRTEEKQNAEDDQMEDKSQMIKMSDESEISETGMSGIKILKGKGSRDDEESDSEKDFNPQEPNYLPVEKAPKAEQVDLKHQDIDERKNSEEWMVDYALQKTVTKLAPVKRKKVELLVEAFESVAPYQT